MIFIFFILILFFIFIKKKKNIENFTDFSNYKHYTFEFRNTYNVGFTFETLDLLPLLKNKLKLNTQKYINSTNILQDVNTNKLDYGLVYDNFINETYTNVKKVCYINYSSHFLITYDNSINNLLDLQGKNICFGFKNTDTYKIGIKIFNLLKIDINIFIPKNEVELIENFNSFRIDALYLNLIRLNSFINKFNLDKLHFIDLTNDIDRDILYRLNLLKYKTDNFLFYKNYNTVNNPSNNIYLICNSDTNHNSINEIFSKLIKLHDYKIKIYNNFLTFKTIGDIMIDDNESFNRYKSKNDKIFNSFYYKIPIDYHAIIINKYIKLGYITEKKNINCVFNYKKSKC